MKRALFHQVAKQKKWKLSKFMSSLTEWRINKGKKKLFVQNPIGERQIGQGM